jgi:hypothetical protein
MHRPPGRSSPVIPNTGVPVKEMVALPGPMRHYLPVDDISLLWRPVAAEEHYDSLCAT